jgi:hypothetical protein
MEPLPGEWKDTADVGNFSYTCGHCGAKTGVRVGYYENSGRARIYICGGCNRPTFYDELYRLQIPQSIIGNSVSNLPEQIETIYQQARQCAQVAAYTACVLVCRNILMYIAVEKGAPPNQRFIQYVEYLANNGYVPPNGKGWVDHIRVRGNDATHEIVLMTPDDAFELLSFVEMLLKFVYEFPARIMPTSATV